MAGFGDEDELYKYIGGIFRVAFEDPELEPKMKATNMVFAMHCVEPESALTIDMANGQVYKGHDGPTPDAIMNTTTETANGYWQGKVNLPIAMARGKVKVEGSMTKLMALAPLGKKLFPRYIDMLKADGREDLIVQ
jgi:hypothetical protein